MPTIADTNRFAALTLTQIELVLAEMAERHAAEDAERRARHAAILATFEGR